MTLLLDQKAREAVIHGPPRTLMDGAAPTVIGEYRPSRRRGAGRADPELPVRRDAEGADFRRNLAAIRRNRRPIAQASGSALGARPFCCWATFSTSFRVSGRRCAWARPRLRSPASPIPPRRKTSESLTARLERPALIADTSTTDSRPAGRFAAGAPVLRISALSGENDGDEDTNWIPATSLTSSVCFRPPGRPEA